MGLVAVAVVSACTVADPAPPSGNAGMSATAGSGGASNASAGSANPTAGVGAKPSEGVAGSAVAGAGDNSSGTDGGGAPGTDGGTGSDSGTGNDAGAGGAAEPGEIVIASGQKTPTGIALSANFVYWANRDAGTIVRCPLQGCAGNEPTLLASNIGTPQGLALDDKEFYWITTGGVASACPLSGCTGVPRAVMTLTEVGRPLDIHVVGSTLYLAGWPNFGTCPTSGCGKEWTSIERMPAIALGSQGDKLFVASRTSVFSCTLGGCGERASLAVREVVGLAVDATHVYFGESDYLGLSAADPIVPAVSRCPITGCGEEAPELIADGEVSPFGVAVNDTRVFFTNYLQGSVVSIAKPD